LMGRPAGKRPLKDPGVDGDHIKTGLQGVEWRDKDWIDLAQDRDQVAGACKCDNKRPVSVNFGEFLN